jgi:hypothetical protein
MDQAALLDHQFRVAAYAVTWAIQFSYLAWLGYRWWVQRDEKAWAARQRAGKSGSQRS